ncbi:MAG: RluA family pseudouridine synthase [Candidatus Izemoplasmatales bacterium]
MELIYRVKKPETIKRFMTENNIPTSILQKDEKNYKIFVNNEIKSRKDTVRKGDKIHFLLEDEGLNKNVKPEDYNLEIVYEDESIIIVNKPSNMLMTVSKTNPSHTLANFIVGYYSKNNINNMIHFVNKIDRESSGLVVIAKHRFIKFLLSNKVDNELQFSFKAIVDGVLDVKDFNICLPIKKQDDSYIREITEEGGEECTTKYHVEKEFRNYSLLDLEVTGKVPHQIRVHLAFFNKPIVGDKIYNKHEYPQPLMLVCYKTSFIHPVTEQPIDARLDLPKHFIEFINTSK